MHPSLILFGWLFAVLQIQLLPAIWLAVCGLIAFWRVSPPVRTHFFSLLRRSRWILLTLALAFVFLTPGERLVAGFWASKEGLQAGGEQMLRLLLVLLAVAWLVGGRSTEWLLSAMWGLLATFRLPLARAFIVRLALTLRYAVDDERRASWRALLSAASSAPAHAEPEIELEHRALTPGERWCVAAVFLAALASLAGPR